MVNGKEPINATLTYNKSSGQPNGHLLGLTKREYFAGLVMVNILSSKNSYYDGNSKGAMIPQLVAKDSIMFADELLKQLEKQ